jgi:hypothetical protein
MPQLLFCNRRKHKAGCPDADALGVNGTAAGVAAANWVEILTHADPLYQHLI